MRIGIFSECYKPIMNGVSVSIETFKKGLEEKGHQVFIFAPDNDKAIAEHGVYRFPCIEDKKGRLYPILIPSLTLEGSYLPKEIISSLDIIHAQHMFTAGRLARHAACQFNKPLVYTYHTLLAEYTHYLGFLSPLVRVYLRNMSKRFCNSCDQIITPSNPMKKILQNYGIATPIEVIMTGIEPQAYKRVGEQAGKQLREKYKIDPEAKICLYVSRIAKEKNLDFLFKSFIKIHEKYPKCHLLMVGGGPEEEWAHNRVKELGVENKVTFTGMLPKEETNKLFGFGDVFTFPSYTETQGIVIAEAMAAGTPPVAVGKMGPLDLIHDGKDGYLTKLSISDFSEKVIKLLQDDKLHDIFVTEGLKRVAEFSNEASVSKLISLYEKVLDRANSSVQDTLEAEKVR
jgi:glycosyltransferase involved in cell wall biosynthesis